MLIEKERLYQIFNNMKNKNILIIGDVMVDEYIFGNVERISQEAPVPILDVNKESLTLGGAANVAKNIKSLESNVWISSVIGYDSTGEKLYKLLEHYDINTDGLISDYHRKTTLKTRIIASNQQLVRIDRESRDQINENQIDGIIGFMDSIPNIDAIIISDYAKGIFRTVLLDKIKKFIGEKDITINVDPKEKNYDKYKGVTLITPNLKELSLGTKIKIENEKDIEIAVRKTFNILKCKNVIVTRGKDGMSIFNEDLQSFYVPTVAKKVFDVTGAGDTVISCFVLTRLGGASLEEAAIISNVAAGIVVGEIGSSVATIDKISNEFEELNKQVTYN